MLHALLSCWQPLAFIVSAASTLLLPAKLPLPLPLPLAAKLPLLLPAMLLLLLQQLPELSMPAAGACAPAGSAPACWAAGTAAC